MREARCALIGRDCWWSWVRLGVPGLVLTWPHHSRLLMTLWLPSVIHVEGTSESLALTHTHVRDPNDSCPLLMTADYHGKLDGSGASISQLPNWPYRHRDSPLKMQQVGKPRSAWLLHTILEALSLKTNHISGLLRELWNPLKLDWALFWDQSSQQEVSFRYENPNWNPNGPSAGALTCSWPTDHLAEASSSDAQLLPSPGSYQSPACLKSSPTSLERC